MYPWPHTLARHQHSHDFGQLRHSRAASRTTMVALLTLVTMVVEIFFGLLTGSMALLADGLHMGGHALALGLASLSYALMRRYALDRRLSFGSGKIGDLAAYTSTLLLALSVVWMFFESLHRLFYPRPLMAAEALVVTLIGLVVNLLSAFWLHNAEDGGHDHHHHSHGHSHDHHHGDKTDYNLRAALTHVLADLATSVAALIGLLAAWLWGWVWLDPLIALAASVVITRWVISLLRQSTAVLLDTQDKNMAHNVRQRLATIADTAVTDLHLWRIGSQNWTLVAVVVHDGKATPEDYRATLADLPNLHHPIIEVQYCPCANPEAAAAPAS